MSIFNPDVPAGRDEMPSWLRQTSPISSLEVDRSAGLGLAAAGAGIEGAAGLIETTAKDVINKDVRNTVEPIRDEYTNQLLAGKAIIQGAGNVTAPASSSGQDGQPLSLLSTDASKESIPEGINQGLSKIAGIQAFMQNGAGGKYGADQTYYDMRLKTAVTSLRERYGAGFYDYIDSRVSAITGMNPANEMVNDLQRQMAQLQSSKRSEFDKTLDMARKAIGDGLYDSKRMFDYLQQNGEAGVPKYLDYFYETNRKRAILEEQERARKSSKADREDMVEKRTADWTNEVGTGVSSAMNSFVKLTGMDEQKTLLGFIQDANNNPGKYSAEQLKELGLRFSAQKAELSAQFTARASTTKVDDKGVTYSYNSDVGAPAAKTIQDNVMGVYDQIEKALADNKVGLAFAHANRAAGMLDTERNKIYSGPLGEDMRKFKILNEDMGTNWASIANTQLIKNSIDKTVDKLFENRVLGGKTGEKTADGKPVTYKGMADEALSLEQGGQISKRLRARYLEGGLNIFVEDITNKDAPIQGKLNALKFFFSPEGQGLLQHFNNDSYDYSKGVNLPGRQTVWGKLTSDAVVSEVKRLSAVDPNIGNMYHQWTEREAGAQLYMKDLKALGGFTGTDDVHIKYSDGEHGGIPRIQLIDREGNDLRSLGVDTTSRRYYQHMQQTVGRVNEALAGMHRVETGLGTGNASDALLNFMREAQVDVGEWKGIPKELMDAIAATRGKGKLKDIMEQGVTK